VTPSPGTCIFVSRAKQVNGSTKSERYLQERDAASVEADLTRRAVVGSFAAFEELVYLFEKRIYGFVFQYCHNEADAKEITQDTFVRAFQALDQFDLKYPFGPWLFAIARRKCIDFYRARRPAADCHIPEQIDSRDPSRLLSQREDRENLWALARGKLSRLEFDVVWLRYAEEMDVREIARIVRKTRTHVKVTLFRARKALAREIESSSTEPAEVARSAAAFAGSGTVHTSSVVI